MDQDNVDRLLQKLADANAPLDLDVEGIVDRIGHIHKRIHWALKETLVEYGLTPEDWHVMSSLGLRGDGRTASPGALARDLELSSGAMTSRLDRLEQLGYVHRLPDPDDRRGVRVGLTDAGRKAWEGAIEVQGRKEAFFASVLTKKEQRTLNDLLRKIALGLEATREGR